MLLPQSYQTLSVPTRAGQVKEFASKGTLYSRRFWLSIVTVVAMLSIVGYYTAYEKESDQVVNAVSRFLDDQKMMDPQTKPEEADMNHDLNKETLNEDYSLAEDTTLQTVTGPYQMWWQNYWKGGLYASFYSSGTCAVRSLWSATEQDRRFAFDKCYLDSAPGWSVPLTLEETRGDATWTRECRDGWFVSTIESSYDDRRKDRSWLWKCAQYGIKEPVGVTWVHSGCEYSDYSPWETDFDMPCAANKMIAGVNSYHDNGKEDRKFRWRCCGVVKQEGGAGAAGGTGPEAVAGPYWGSYANDWDKTLDLVSPDPFCGVSSYHDNSYEDRRFKFATCAVESNLGFESMISLETTEYDQSWTRDCDSGSFLVGAYSYHSNSKEDRTWTWKCAKYGARVTDPSSGTWVSDDCEYTEYNDYDMSFTVNCPTNKVLAGVTSYHYNGREDRKYRWKCCAIVRTA